MSDRGQDSHPGAGAATPKGGIYGGLKKQFCGEGGHFGKSKQKLSLSQASDLPSLLCLSSPSDLFLFLWLW
jgi:hypothetical protein